MMSDYIWQHELTIAFKLHEDKKSIVVPVIVRPVDFGVSPLAKFQALPKDALAVMRWTDPDDAWVDVTQHIRALLEKHGMLN